MKLGDIHNILHYNWLQIAYSIPNSWNVVIRGTRREVYEGHSVFDKSHICLVKNCHPISNIIQICTISSFRQYKTFHINILLDWEVSPIGTVLFRAFTFGGVYPSLLVKFDPDNET